MVSDVSIGTALDQQSKTAAASTQLADDFSDFLNLLTVQLQNQDPLDPMDTSEFTNQIVAFTGVEQQINTNQKLDDLVAINLGNSLGSALGYVGLDISYISGEFNFDGTTPASINYALNRDAAETTIRILDESGDIIYEEDGSKNVGNNQFTWDGVDDNGNPVPEGTYQVRVDSLDPEGNPIIATTVVQGRVEGIETQNGLLFAIVGERAVAISNVLNAKQPNVIENTSTAEDPPSTEEEGTTDAT